MTTIFHESFDAALGDPPWSSIVPPLGDISGGEPYNSGGDLHLKLPGPITTANSSGVASSPYPLRCTQWTWTVGDIPTATITASTEDVFDMALAVGAGNGNFAWQFRYQPPDVPPGVGTAGTDTAVMLYPFGFVTFPPFADSISGPELTFDITLHKYLRIVETCGEVTWQYSADGITWTDHYVYDLDPQFSYTGSGSSDWAVSISAHAFENVVFEVTVEDVLGETVEPCPCGGGWRLGGTGTPRWA